MSGYAASGRIVRANPRMVRHDADSPQPAERARDDGTAELDDWTFARAGEPVSVAERWERFRDRWDQLTFFVTDPNSWR